MTLGKTLPLEGPRSRPLTGDENQPLKLKSRRPGAQVELTVLSAEATALAEAASPMATTTSAPTTPATCPPTLHQRATAAPKHTGRSSLPFSPQERERDRPRTRVPPSQRAACCATPRCSRRRRKPGRGRPARGTTAAQVEDGQLHPGPAAAVRLPPYGWRMPPPQSWRMSSSPECWRKKRVAGPRGGRPQLAPPSSSARMMKILEAEGGAEAAARLASPHHKADDHPSG
jgi:hypothetical protein